MQLSDMADFFMKYDYTETKDLCKQFLTLVSGILVFSITFSEKIINFQQASTKTKLLLLLSWLLFVLAITCCGIALCYLALAAGEAVYGGTVGNNFQATALTAYALIIAAGFSFVLGLLSLIGTAALSIFTSK